jgi:nodulation protein E
LTDPDRRAVVTGMGVVCATGLDAPSFLASLRAGRVGIGPITGIPTERLSVRVAAEAAGLDPASHFEPRRLALLDRSSQLALIAAREAMAQAGLQTGPAAGAVVMAGAIGLQTFDQSYGELYGRNAPRVHPFTVPRIMPSAPASHISMEFGLRGPVYSVATACASANHAIGQAMHMIRSGMVEFAVTGGADAPITVGFMKGWEALRVLSPDTCRPFSRDRAGIVIGEGAGVFVLESARHARARGAVVLAEIAGFGMSADAAELTAPSADGAARAMQAALADAGCAPEGISYVNAHGTGTRLNDRTEVAALRSVFGAHAGRLMVSSTKSMIGHCMTAGAAVELAATIMALRDGLVPPTAGFTGADPDCDVDCVPNEARPADVAAAMSNAFAFGGLNAVLVARRWAA